MLNSIIGLYQNPTALKPGNFIKSIKESYKLEFDGEVTMKEECLVCKSPLKYLKEDIEMECFVCHKKENSKTHCIKGHYVCNECHTRGMDVLISFCLNETSKNPIEIINKMMSLPFCHMHGPEHHIMVGMALITAYKNAGGNIEFENALCEMMNRGKSVPGGACGFWGACGAGISSGMFVSIISGSTPLESESFGLSHKMTSRSLESIGDIGGPRCCKRGSYISILNAIDFVKENFGIQMEKSKAMCEYSSKNNQCIGKRCPFSKVYNKDILQNKKVAFVCVHNSCRSQIAEALGKHLRGNDFEFYSCGTETKAQINQDAVRLVKKLYGIDMEEKQYSKTYDKIPTPDVVISMGCDVDCPYIGKGFDDNWNLQDPTGESDDVFIDIIKQIEEKIMEL